jgi:hypothetical protein
MAIQSTAIRDSGKIGELHFHAFIIWRFHAHAPEFFNEGSSLELEKGRRPLFISLRNLEALQNELLFQIGNHGVEVDAIIGEADGFRLSRCLR